MSYTVMAAVTLQALHEGLVHTLHYNLHSWLCGRVLATMQIELYNTIHDEPYDTPAVSLSSVLNPQLHKTLDNEWP